MKTKLQISLTVIFISMLLISCVNSGKKNSEQSKANEPVYELDETFLKDY
jgi:PBP1b-binding outer membrane lipoprotein LpoB